MHAFLSCLFPRLICLFRVCAVVLAGNALASVSPSCSRCLCCQGQLMTTPSREKLVKKLLQQQEALGGGMKKRRHTPTHQPRGHRLQQLPSPTEQQLYQRESGWNDRFFYETPVNSNKLPRPERIIDNVPKSPPPVAAAAQHKREKKIHDERLQYGTTAWSGIDGTRGLVGSSLLFSNSKQEIVRSSARRRNPSSRPTDD